MIFVVLGMHKSGTTLVSQILHHSGVNMGDFTENVSYDKGNKYERQSCLELNLAILGASDYEVLQLTAGENLSLASNDRKTMRLIIEACEMAGTDWGFKDPRCCLTYDLWATELPAHKLIVVYRSPDNIWPRFKWHGKRRYHTNFHRAYSFLKRWHEYNVNVLNILDKATCDVVVINYHEFMGRDEGFVKLENLVGRSLQDKRQPGLYRSRHKRDLFMKVADRLLAQRYGLTIDLTIARLDKWSQEKQVV